MNMKESGQKRRAINNARSTLSSMNDIERVPFGQNDSVCGFIQGIYNNELLKPKYEVMWEPDLVSNYISCMEIKKNLNLKDLTFIPKNL